MGSENLTCKPGFVVDHIREWARLPHFYIATHQGANASNQFTGDIYIGKQQSDKLGRFLAAYNVELYRRFQSIVTTPAFSRFAQDGKITREEINTIPAILREIRNSADEITQAANQHYRADIIANYHLIAGLAALFAESDCAVLPEETPMGKIKDNAPWVAVGTGLGLAIGLVVGFRKSQSGGPQPVRTRAPAPEEIPTTAFGRWRERMKVRHEANDMDVLYSRTSRRPKSLNDSSDLSPYLSQRTAQERTRQLRQQWHRLGGDRNNLYGASPFNYLYDPVVTPILLFLTSGVLNYMFWNEFTLNLPPPPANRQRR